MRLTNPYENALTRHPKLRLYIVHAAWPMLDQIIALLYAHPQVYVDISLVDWYVARKEFHFFLRRLVEAGFETPRCATAGATHVLLQTEIEGGFVSAGGICCRGFEIQNPCCRSEWFPIWRYLL